MSNKNKNQTRLTLDHIIQDDKQYDELKIVKLKDGLFTEVCKKFRPSRIDDMLESFVEFQEKYKVFQKKEMKEKDYSLYLMLFIVLYFSTAVEDIPESFEGKIDIFEKMKDNESIEKITESFDKREVDKIMDIVFKKLEGYLEMQQAQKDYQKKFRRELDKLNLENREILESLFFGNDEDADVSNKDA